MARTRRQAGFTLVEVLVVLVFLTIVVALLGPAFARSSRQQKIEACAANLRALHAAQQSYYANTPEGSPELGKAYWEKLAKTTPPLVRPEALTCPLRDRPEGSPAIQYYGPAADPRTLKPEEPIGADLDTNHDEHGHEGGNVLLKSGSVVNDNPQNEDGLWMTAVRRGKVRP